ncbi:MAG: cold shock domain-containing protein [Bacteriovoracaceae bacterium]|nr:cold shock domain-containing protein [Bacteriovoracaceae bacterium]
MSKKLSGKIVRVSPDSDYGFVKADDLFNDVFIHVNQINTGSLKKGDEITFTLGTTQKGSIGQINNLFNKVL